MTIADDEAAPTVSFSSNAVTVAEDDGTVAVILELTHPSASALAIPVSTADETATAGSDYTALTDMNVTIAAGMTTQTVSIAIMDDDIDEADERFTVNIGSSLPEGVKAGSSSGQKVTVTITDDDVPELSLSLPDGVTSLEEGRSTTLTIQASSAVPDIDSNGGLPVYLNFGATSTADQTHLDLSTGADISRRTVPYDTNNYYRVLIPTGQTSLALPIGTLDLTADASLVLELIEDLADPDNYTVSGTADSITLSLTNDVTPPGAVSGLTATPDPNSLAVSVNFTPPSDTDLSRVVIGWRESTSTAMIPDENTESYFPDDTLPVTITVTSAGNYEIVVWTVDNRDNGSQTTTQVSTTVTVAEPPRSDSEFIGVPSDDIGSGCRNNGNADRDLEFGANFRGNHPDHSGRHGNQRSRQ